MNLEEHNHARLRSFSIGTLKIAGKLSEIHAQLAGLLGNCLVDMRDFRSTEVPPELSVLLSDMEAEQRRLSDLASRAAKLFSVLGGEVV